MIPPEKAKGLKPIFPAGTDNTGIGLEVQKIDNLITVTCLIPFTRGSEYKIKVPESLAIEITSGCERSNDIEITGMKNEIDIKTCHEHRFKRCIRAPCAFNNKWGYKYYFQRNE